MCLGNGYPALEIGWIDEGAKLIVEYYRGDVAVGDVMTYGVNRTEARTYAVRSIRPSPERDGAVWLGLESIPIPVTVGGKTYG